MTLREYLQRYRAEHGLSQRQFASQCGLSNGYISMIENNINPKTGLPVVPSFPAYTKIATGMGMSVDELFRNIDDAPINIDDDNQNTKSSTRQFDNIMPMPKMRKVPLIGTIACGKPILAVEDADEDIDIPDFVNADFALRCKGDSMINARIFDGDVVYIKQQSSVDNGDIAAVIVGEEATLKKVYYLQGERLILRACNPMYPDLEYFGETLNEIEILGKAVSFVSAVRG